MRFELGAPPGKQSAIEGFHQRLELERLQEMIDCARAQGIRPQEIAVIGRHADDRKLHASRPQLSAQVDPRETRQMDVDQRAIGLDTVAGSRQDLLGAREAVHGISRGRQRPAERAPDAFVVIDENDPGPHGSVKSLCLPQPTATPTLAPRRIRFHNFGHKIRY